MPASSHASPTSGDAAHLLAAVAADRDVVDPRPVQLLQLVEPAGRALSQLRDASRSP